MDWIKQLEESLEYIEENLKGNIDTKVLGEITRSSSYHYQRMFSYIAGVTLSEYIRRRRMTLAVVDLRNGEKVIDVALKYGYDSPDSFARAFKKLVGVTPSEASKDGVSLKTYPRIHFSIVVKGDVEMKYKIEKKAAFRVLGAKKEMSEEVEQNFVEVPKFWHELAVSGKINNIISHMSNEFPGVLGISVGFSSIPDDELAYYVAVASEDDDSDLISYEVPECTWAIFSGNGTMPKAIQELEVRIVTEWLPSSGYEYGKGPDIERYLNQNPENSEFEVWISIVKKEEVYD